MVVLVDTPIWSLAFRRKRDDLSAPETEAVAILAWLIGEKRARMIGPVRQELLTGLRDRPAFQRVRELLRAFDDEPLHPEDYEVAARSANECRLEGVATTPVDMLICAVALRRNWEVYTADRDFDRYAKCLAVSLLGPVDEGSS
jgi:predicted nucleic acid-binding protein